MVASATFNAGGGTVLMKMADLNLVQVRTLVDETDIGKIKAGQATTVTVDAYPNRPFKGEVLKIEPLAEVQQNVTMFPVLVRIDNREGLLRPGMNSEVEIHVGRRDSVLAVPNSALRTQKDVESAAGVLGLTMEQVNTQLAAAQAGAAARATPRRRARCRSVPVVGAAAAAAPAKPGGQHDDDARRPRGQAARGRHRGADARHLRQVPERRAAHAGGARSCCRRCGS